MDLYKAIQDLRTEKEKLERVIASLEDLQRAAGGSVPPMSKSEKKRGRKSMNAEEREQVSARMKKYWAGRKDENSQKA